eukprot:6073196-Pleurochrysis_carterae.AAC.1
MSKPLTSGLLMQMQAAIRQGDEEWDDLVRDTAHMLMLVDDDSSDEGEEERDYCLRLDSRGLKRRRGGWGRRARSGSQLEEATKGERMRCESHLSPWWKLMKDRTVDDEGSASGRKFRGRFRVPKKVFDELVKATKE